MSSVAHIIIAPAKRAPAQSVAAVEALANQGLRGDRYAESKNRRGADYQVTLIEIENIEGFVEATHLALTPAMPRRNIVTRGVRLNPLVGRRFRVGEATFEGIELCEPCGAFARFAHREVLKHLVHKAGLRARIVAGGTIRVGDAIGVLE